MISTILAYALLCLLVFFAIYTGKTYFKFLSLGALALLGTLSYFLIISIEGYPFPAPYVTGRVVQYTVDPGKTIYLWVIPRGEKVPRAYSVGWSKDRENELRDAKQREKETGQQTEVNNLPQDPQDDPKMNGVSKSPGWKKALNKLLKGILGENNPLTVPDYDTDRPTITNHIPSAAEGTKP